MITEGDVYDFTKGACFLLADAIAEATGWERCAFPGFWSEYGIHAFVRTPDDMYLDVNGRQTADEIMTRWEQDEIVTYPEYHEWNLPSGWDYEKKESRARELASYLIQV